MQIVHLPEGRTLPRAVSEARVSAPGSRPQKKECDVTHTADECDVTHSSDEYAGLGLDELARLFRTIACTADDSTIMAAVLVNRMRLLIESGAAGPEVTWYSWARKLGLSDQRVYRFQRIAQAPDRRAMLEEFLLQDRARAKKSKTKKKVTDPKRIWLIEWSRKAPLAWVEHVRASIEKGKMEL